MRECITREAALAALRKYNQEPFHLQHALTVEGVMRWYARELGYGQEADFWATAGLLHDIDFEQWPEQHCQKAPELLREAGCGDDLIRAVCSHGYGICCDVEPTHLMEKVLFAADELTGLIGAAALMRPSRSCQDMEVKSLKKKYKDKKFAAGCSRDVIQQGADRLGWTLEELMEKTILAMRSCEDAVNAASAFDEALGIDGVVLTKLDGDARGGAALSIKAATGKPIKFVGTGEKLDMIELFHPDRMASRILGMGDMLTFSEKAEQQYDEEQARKLEEKLRKNRLTLTDYMEQMDQLQKMGNLGQLAGMLPGDMGKQLDAANLDEKQLGRTRAIIQSMTPLERENPSILNASRKKRIAAGCGLQVSDVNRLLKSFEMLQQLTKSISKGRFGGFGGPGGMPTLGKAKKGKLQGFGRKKRLK